MKRTIMKHTQIRVAISLTVIAQRDGDTRLATLPLIHLTTLVMLLWSLGQWVDRVKFEVSVIVQRLTQAAIQLTFGSLVFGVG